MESLRQLKHSLGALLFFLWSALPTLPDALVDLAAEAVRSLPNGGGRKAQPGKILPSPLVCVRTLEGRTNAVR